MLALALSVRQLVVDRLAHERVDERDRRLGVDEVGAHERGGGGGDGRLVELGEQRERAHVGALAEDRDGACDGGRGRVSGARGSSSTVRETARGPTSWTIAVAAAVGATPSAARPASSWRSSSGLPPVTSPQASQKGGGRSGSSPLPRRLRTSSRTPQELVGGPGRTKVASGSCAISPRITASVPGSLVRIVAATSTGWMSSRRSR